MPAPVSRAHRLPA